ncbi:alpha/beta fold hydrolase [Phormidium tenue FACHB-886]|nr:alpha/beta fold hydrolase [Phormidium tenue FACHB-886]
MQQYFYLHGFASSPRSTKAQFLSRSFQALGLSLVAPDLNQDDFYHLTLTRQIEQVRSLLPEQPITLIGSSFGGLTAAWLAEQSLQIKQLVLLAPAFQFLAHWLPRLGEAQLQQWQEKRSLMVYHYSEQIQLPLDYAFVSDAAQYDETQIQRPVPTLILHGRQDDVIPIQASRDYAADRSWVRLIELDSDHALGDVQLEIWQAIRSFCQLPA